MVTKKDIDRVPFISPDQIENRATQFLERAAPEVFIRPIQTPLIKVANHLSAKYGVRFDFETNLGNAESGERICGLCRFDPPEILIDKQLFEEREHRFTLAHEIGHFILHRHVTLSQRDYEDGALIKTKKNWSTGKRQFITATHRLEWQAARFSAALLMPRRAILFVVVKTQESLGINQNLGLVYITAPESNKNFRIIQQKICEIFGVSMTAADYRLSDLKLKKDLRNKDVYHVSRATHIKDLI